MYNQELSIRAAERMYEQATEAQARGGCLEIAALALGAHVKLQEVIDRVLDGFPIHEQHKFLLERNLLTGWRCIPPRQISDHIIREILTSTLEIPSGYDLIAQKAGFLCLMYFPHSVEFAGIGESHAFAVLNRTELEENERAFFEANDEYPVVDTKSGGFVAFKPSKFVSLIEETRATGGEFIFFEIWRKNEDLSA